ncbi:MAG: prenyltransferase [Acidimicrobiales bacterium]
MPLTAGELAQTVDSIAAVQLDDGMIPWFPGGHADPWNHVEAAMALTVGGRMDEAHRAFEWLMATQRPDGAWHQYYVAGYTVEVPLLDANVTAYVASGVWHHYLATGDAGFLAAMWQVVERALGFVRGLQAPGGEVIWARHADGTPWSFALLTASSSTTASLRCGAAIAQRLGLDADAASLEHAAARLREAIADRPWSFLPKDRWSMDWYYPVLAGILTGDAATERLDRDWDRFVMGGLGVRCVADRPWVTAAETSEAAMACAAAGRLDHAHRLFQWAQHLRAEDGSYFTGMVHPERAHFPGGERTTYSAAAIVLAADTITGTGPTAATFLVPGLGARPN